MSDCNSHTEVAAIIDEDVDDQQHQQQQQEEQGEQQIQQILPNMLNKLEIRPNAGQLKLSESDCLNPFYVFNCTPSQITKNELNEQEKLFGSQNMNIVDSTSSGCCKCCSNQTNSINSSIGGGGGVGSMTTIRNNQISTKSSNLKPPEHSLYNQTQFKQRKKPEKKLLKSSKLKLIGKCLHHCLTFKPSTLQQIGQNTNSSSNNGSESTSSQSSQSLGGGGSSSLSVLNLSKHEHCCCCYGYNNNNNCCIHINTSNNNNNNGVACSSSSSGGGCRNSRYTTTGHHQKHQNSWNFNDDDEFVDFKSLITECASLSISPEAAELHKSQSFRTRHIKTNNLKKSTKIYDNSQNSLADQLNPHNRTILVPIVELDEATSSSIFNRQQQTQQQQQQQHHQLLLQQQQQLDRGNGNSTCSQQALLNETNCDVTIDELASYFETFVHIPKKMSTMAEMMYI